MADRKLQTLREVLRDAVQASRRTNRELERILGLGSGNLARLLDGSLDLRVRHLVALAELLDVSPADFLELGFPKARRADQARLSDWIGGPRPANSVPATREELSGMIREIVEEILARREGRTGGGTRPRD